MIPNVGNMSFYMSTMICDFSSEILEQFALLVSILLFTVKIRKTNKTLILVTIGKKN
jgi:hypothetical protein